MTYFLAGELSAAERDARTARFQVIPVPLECTVSYGGGTARGAAAILEASTQLERLVRGVEPCARGIATQAEVNCTGPLPKVMEAIATRTQAAVQAGAIPVILGGEHAVSVFFEDAEALVVGNVQAVDLPPNFPKNIYVSFDVDGLDPSILPDTGTPVPGGLGYYQALNLVRHALHGRHLVGCDVVELAPLPQARCPVSRRRRSPMR